MSGKKILIDDDGFCRFDNNSREARDYVVDSTPDGTERFQKAKAIPNLIILDVMMTKNTEGFEVSREFQKDKDLKSVPIIMITGIREQIRPGFRL